MESITIKEIAKLSGVGVSTVSRAINNHPDINQETKARVMEVIKEYNYIPNNSARNLKRTNSKTIAVLIKGISNPFFTNMIKTFEKEIINRKYSFILQRVDEQEDEFDLALQLVKEKRLGGIVFLGGTIINREYELSKLTVPFILSTIGMNSNSNHNLYSFASVDDYNESYKMVNYLCSLGHRKIAIICEKEREGTISIHRYIGYIKALQENGIPLNKNLVRYMHDGIETFSMANGYEVTRELLESKEEFTAIYAISDTLAIGACKALTDIGKRVPEDYSVAGFDGLDIAYYYNPSITTIKQPSDEIAGITIGILFDLIKNKHKGNQSHIFTGELYVGQSTRAID